MCKRRSAILGAALAPVLSIGWAQHDTDIAAEMVVKARAYLGALSPAERRQSNLAFDDSNRYDWHYVPRQRQGLPHTAMTEDQSALADALMDTALSDIGREKARGIRELDDVLFEISGSSIRDSDRYYVTVFGEPASEGPWGWRVEGHHLSLNLTLEDGEVISSSPTFMGANPAIVQSGPRVGMQVLEQEQSLARELLLAFDAEQRRVVVYADRPPRDIETRASRRAAPGSPRGLPMSAMTETQSRLLVTLIEVYANRLRPALAARELARIRSDGLDTIHFAWAGSGEPGEPHYYRIQGPRFLIEYDNRQNGANHIHSVWRNLTGEDFGEDLLAKHYAESPHHVAERSFAWAGPEHLRTGLVTAAEMDN